MSSGGTAVGAARESEPRNSASAGITGGKKHRPDAAPSAPGSITSFFQHKSSTSDDSHNTTRTASDSDAMAVMRDDAEQDMDTQDEDMVHVDASVEVVEEEDVR